MRFKRKRRKLIINILTIAIPILSVVAIYFGLQIILSTATPLVTVASGSMSPALETGDLIVIQGIPANSIQVGAIIVFDSPSGTRTIHRVTRIQTLQNGTIQFKTKGDANSDEDLYWTLEENVHGQILHRIPYIGWIALDPAIPMTIIIILIIVVIIWPEKRRKLRR